MVILVKTSCTEEGMMALGLVHTHTHVYTHAHTPNIYVCVYMYIICMVVCVQRVSFGL